MASGHVNFNQFECVLHSVFNVHKSYEILVCVCIHVPWVLFLYNKFSNLPQTMNIGVKQSTGIFEAESSLWSITTVSEVVINYPLFFIFVFKYSLYKVTKKCFWPLYLYLVRNLMGEDLGPLSSKELETLERQLDSSLKQIRSTRVLKNFWTLPITIYEIPHENICYFIL
jgi:hypothetical protein